MSDRRTGRILTNEKGLVYEKEYKTLTPPKIFRL